MQPWPPKVAKASDWDGIYANQKGELLVVESCDDAVAWVNDFIAKIDAIK